MTREERKQMRQMNKALDDFPRIVALKAKRARERKKFLEKTFGPLVRQLERHRKKYEL
jgi:hypothetical protein